MQTIKKLFSLVILIVILLSACSQNRNISLALCGSYAVPGMFCPELKGGTFDCDTIESDEEGRVLFSYTTHSNITNRTETAMVICQSITSDYVYFYEDICYFIGEPDATQLADLKKNNDWSKPLNKEKMSCRPNKVSIDMWIITDSKLEIGVVQTKALSLLGVPEGKAVDMCILDCSPSGQELLWLRVEREGVQEDYWVIAQSNYAVSLLPASREKLETSTIVDFKQQNKWDYGIP